MPVGAAAPEAVATKKAKKKAKPRAPRLRASAGLLVVCAERILVLERSAESSNPLTWGLPGGRLDRRENAFDAAVREAVEEVGPLPELVVIGQVQVQRSSGVYDVFVCRTSDVTRERWKPKLCAEHKRLRWSRLRWCLHRRGKLHPVLRALLDDPRALELIAMAKVHGHRLREPIVVDPALRRSLAKTL